jgi:hypothetical protein
MIVVTGQAKFFQTRLKERLNANHIEFDALANITARAHDFTP